MARNKNTRRPREARQPISTPSGEGANVPRPLGYAWLRWLCVVLALLLTLGTSPWILPRIPSTLCLNVKAQKVEAYPFDDKARAGYDSLMDQSGTLAIFAGGVIAAIWALICLKPSDAGVVFGEWPERLLLVITMLSLGFSIAAYIIYVDEMAQYGLKASEVGKFPDFNAFAVQYARYSQVLTLALGAVFAILTVINVKWLGESQ
jgi:hypothetical protein